MKNTKPTIIDKELEKFDIFLVSEGYTDTGINRRPSDFRKLFESSLNTVREGTINGILQSISKKKIEGVVFLDTQIEALKHLLRKIP